MLFAPAGPLDASSQRDAAHVAPLVPAVEHAINGAAATAMLPVSLVENRGVNARSACAVEGMSATRASVAIAEALRPSQPIPTSNADNELVADAT